MNYDHLHYVPCLRWKQGEYQAVSRLRSETKQRLIPLIEVPEIGWDFEKKKKAKTVDQHLEPFARRVQQKWGKGACYVDLCLIGPAERMTTGMHPVRFVFNELRKMKSSAIPVTGLARDEAYNTEVKNAAATDHRGACLRLTIEQAAKSTIEREVDSLLLSLGVQFNDCDLILDLDSPNFLPLSGFLMAIQVIAKRFPHLQHWRSFTLIGTSFPETMGGIRIGAEVVPRYEWRLYKLLLAAFKKEGLRLPAFGDYTISHPRVLDLDMRVVKPSATIRYTIDDGWYIVKGKNVRDNGFEQYRSLSEMVLVSPHYCDSGYSWGDEYIMKCKNGSGKTGNLMVWRQVGTNHHVEKVIHDLASFYASSDVL